MKNYIVEILLAGILLLSVIDTVQTWVALRSGRAREKNPVMRWLFRKIGFGVAIGLKLFFVIVFVLNAYMLDEVWVPTSVFALLLCVCLNNVVVLCRRR
ncbi:hypothetical protein ES708_28145 [subsurface metagenome]